MTNKSLHGEDALIQLFESECSDFQQYALALTEIEDINALDPDGTCLLERLFKTFRYAESGKLVPFLTQMVLSRGFDAKRHGAACLSAIVFLT